MDSLIHAFGIDQNLLIAQIINFVILVVALTWIVYKPVMKIVEEREAVIAKGVSDALMNAELKAKTEQEAVTVAKQAQKDAEEIVENAKKTATENRSQILLDAQTRGAKIVKDAEARAADEARAIMNASEKEIARLAVLAAEKVMRK